MTPTIFRCKAMAVRKLMRNGNRQQMQGRSNTWHRLRQRLGMQHAFNRPYKERT